MNKILKILLQNKKIVLTISVFVLLIVILAFFSNNNETKANGLLNVNGTSSSDSENKAEISNTSLFSTYEEYNGKIIKLFKDSDTFNFIDENNSILYSTTDSIDYFRMIDENNLVYITSSLNSATNTNINEIKYIDLQNQKEYSLYSSGKLFLEVSKGKICIVDGKEGTVLYGTKDSLKKYSLKSSVYKVIENKGRVFAINISVINNTIKSVVYALNENDFEKIIQCEGKVQDINVDYENDNLIYYVVESKNKDTKENQYIVNKKYIVNLSPSKKAEEVLSELSSNVISLKDKYISVDYTNKKIYLLNNNLSISSTIGILNSAALKSLIKESSDSSTLYYLNKSGYITKL